MKRMVLEQQKTNDSWKLKPRAFEPSNRDSEQVCNDWDVSRMSLGWKCPPRFIVNPNWLVAAGEESEEVKAQQIRERTPEKVNFTSPDDSIEHVWYDDSKTRVIPTIAIEYLEALEMIYTMVAQNQCEDLSVLGIIRWLREDESLAFTRMIAKLVVHTTEEYKCDQHELFRALGKEETSRHLIEAWHSLHLQARPRSNVHISGPVWPPQYDEAQASSHNRLDQSQVLWGVYQTIVTVRSVRMRFARPRGNQ